MSVDPANSVCSGVSSGRRPLERRDLELETGSVSVSVREPRLLALCDGFDARLLTESSSSPHHWQCEAMLWGKFAGTQVRR
jgi:hypothetical protein